MNRKKLAVKFLIAFLLVPAVCFGGKLGEVVHSVYNRDKHLQAAFFQFPFLTPATNSQGEPAFQTLALKKPVVIDGITFYGFRFRAPKQINQPALVWAFVEPRPRFFWYILPQTGDMIGFADYFRQPRASYQGLDGLFPLKAKHLIIQSLSGNAFAPDKDYLTWFAFGRWKPARISLMFTFVHLHSKNIDKRGTLEKFLDLHHK